MGVIYLFECRTCGAQFEFKFGWLGVPPKIEVSHTDSKALITCDDNVLWRKYTPPNIHGLRKL